MIYLGIYLIIGLTFAWVMTRFIAKLYDEYNNNTMDAEVRKAAEPVLEKGYRVHKQVGDKAFWSMCVILYTLFWLPLLITMPFKSSRA
jgi:hypothetical protein